MVLTLAHGASHSLLLLGVREVHHLQARAKAVDSFGITRVTLCAGCHQVERWSTRVTVPSRVDEKQVCQRRRPVR